MKKKNEVKLTPTPLKSGGLMLQFEDEMRRIDGPDGLLVALVSDRNLKDTTLRDNDAERFVRAVNSHEALLKGLRLAETYLEDGAAASALQVIKEAIGQAEGHQGESRE